MSGADLIAGGVGLHRAGGFAGFLASLIALPVAWLLHWAGGFPLVVIVTVAVMIAISRALPRATVPVVADVFAGQLVGLWALSGGLWFAGVAPHIFPWPGVIGTFFLFNLFRFLPPIHKLGARNPLLDDCTAGLLAASLTLLSAAISHGWL